MYQFDRWVITLGAQVRFLSDQLSAQSSTSLSKEVTRCEKELQSLYVYAHQHSINLIAYYHPFAEIEQGLLRMYDHLKQSK